MAVVLDIENQVELAFIGALTATDITTVAGTPRAWKNAAAVAVYPKVLVHCSPVGDHEATPRGALYVANVEIGIQTDAVADKSQAVLKALAGSVRDVIHGAGLVAALNAVTDVDITFLERGISMESGEHTIAEDEVSQMSFTLVCNITA